MTPASSARPSWTQICGKARGKTDVHRSAATDSGCSRDVRFAPDSDQIAAPQQPMDEADLTIGA